MTLFKCRRLSAIPCKILHRNYFVTNRLHKNISPASDFPDVYKSEDVEKEWYEWWRRKRLFEQPKVNDAKERFSMILPPPNITGTLHLGHALTCVIQDSLCRWHRMRGNEVVWIPGSDHAGIATQMVVEKVLQKKYGMTRHDLGREKFVGEVLKWKKEKGDIIFKQLEMLGSSLDWNRTSFTMSESHTEAVNEAFRILFEKNLIYRGKTLSNWSCVLQSAISDIEVDHINLEKKTKLCVPNYEKPVEFGVLHNVSYKLENSNEMVHVSTTRPETMLGDVAIAVHPGDSRYSHLIGKRVENPLFPGQDLLPIIADEYVKVDFGTGALKITPGHDPNDFEIAKRHNLPVKSVIDDSGRICLHFKTDFQGLKRFDARWAVIKKLKEVNQYHGSKSHPMQVPICSRSGDVVEPILKDQWFLRCSEMASKSLKQSEDKLLKFQPELYHRVWKNWMENIKDWCLSRQLWWGHRIPLYHCSFESKNTWICALSQEEAEKKAVEYFRTENVKDISIIQEEDVLDTWFSSALLPFSNFGWPNKEGNGEELNKYFPLDLMETGHDIIFFWVARMVWLSQALIGQLPFKEVLLHGIICDAHGRKMSKSLGNVIDPVDIINGVTLEKILENIEDSHGKGQISDSELAKATQGAKKDYPNGIPVCGADALRFGLASYDIKSQLINLDLSLVNKSGAFCNKIWQASRYLVLCKERAGEKVIRYDAFNVGEMRAENAWILSRCAATTEAVNSHLKNYDFHLATISLRQYLYTNLCDVFLETTKPVLFKPEDPAFEETYSTLHFALMSGLKMLHPFMPFVTEELFHRLPLLENEIRKESILSENYPLPEKWNKFLNINLMDSMDLALEVVSTIRHLKKTYGVARSAKPNVILVSSYNSTLQDLEKLIPTMQVLSPADDIVLQCHNVDNPRFYTMSSVQGNLKVLTRLREHIDIEKELSRVEGLMEKTEKDKDKFVGNIKKRKGSEKRIQEKLLAFQQTLDQLREQLIFLRGTK